MKNTRFFFSLFVIHLAFTCSIFSQTPVEGIIEYVADIDLMFADFNNICVLKFNKTASLFVATEPSSKETVKDQGNVTIIKSHLFDGVPLYKNTKNKYVESKFKFISESNPCIVKDELRTVDWSILNEFKMISKFKVQKAIGEFGGRTYEVWFTFEIPISNGPHKLGGLPGMILEANSTDGKIKYAFKSYQKLADSKELILPISETIKVPLYDYAAYLKTKEQIVRNKIIEMQSQGYTYTPLDNTKDWQVEKGYY